MSLVGTSLRAKCNWGKWKTRKISLQSHPPSPSSPNNQSIHQVGWSKPQEGFVEINFDRSKSTATVSARYVIRGWKRNFIATGCRFMEDASILVTKVTTMRDGIKAAVDLGFKHIIVKGDNKFLIQSIIGKVKILWEIQTIIDDIRLFIERQVSISFYHIFLESNMVADWMAKYASSSQASTPFSSPIFRDSLYILINDNVGRTLERRATY